ncbi:MAG: AAA family ATPase [Planctomycetales bacterium]|nr:AAA family ATPase [Planctomycetales bacterium]
MKIARLKVDAYGAWTDLELAELSPQLTVFYGANEAGKTTLLQFIRAILYGYAASPRQRYASTGSGRKPEGALDVLVPGGRFTIGRVGRRDGDDEGKVSIRAADGTPHRTHQLHSLLSDVDETIFNNVFAVGLREMQELGTLSDTDAAHWLYSLTSGLDRVSLVDVMRELTKSRRRIYPGEPGQAAQITRLAERRDRLHEQMHDLASQTTQWSRLDGQVQAIDRQIEQLEQANRELTGTAHLLETGISLRERWERRETIIEELQRLGPVMKLDDASIERLGKLVQQLREAQSQREQMRGEYQSLRMQYQGIVMNEPLWRQLPRIEALAEQEDWIHFLENRTGELEEEIASLQAEQATLSAQLGVSPGATGGDQEVEFSDEVMSSLRGPARAVQEAKQQLAGAEESASDARNVAAEHRAERDGEAVDLATALEEAGQRVAMLRRRIEIDEKLAKIQRAHKELDEDSQDLLDRELEPVWFTAVIGIGLALAAMVFLYGQLVESSKSIWFGALLGASCAIAWVIRRVFDQSMREEMDEVHEQLAVVEKQKRKLESERETIDVELPDGGGPFAVRLKAAEKHLAELEARLPAETRKQSALDETRAAESRLDAARDAMRRAERQWIDALAAAGLPRNLAPKDLRGFQDQARQFGAMAEKLESLRTDLASRREEYHAILERIQQLMSDTGLTAGSGGHADKIRRLTLAGQQQRQLAEQRAELRRQGKEIKREAVELAKTIAGLRKQSEVILKKAGASDTREFAQLAERYHRGKKLKAELAALRREIEAALGNHATEEEMAELLDEEEGQPLENRWEAVGARIEANQTTLKSYAEQRGQLLHQQSVLVEDRRLAQIRCELEAVEAQIDEALLAWQIRATASTLLEKIRQEVETNRQPETLVEASRYLTDMTQGKYHRVWTPFGEETLYVEDQDGKTWPVDHLSRGTREQLYLSVRLALVALYARRGVQLPVILDDVLVNFDSGRARAAARMLVDFAGQGHQLLIFTCHEHVWAMFHELGADVRRLPRRDGAEDELTLPEPVIIVEPPVEEVVEEEPVDEVVEAEPEPVEDEVEEEAEEEVEEYEPEPDEEVEEEYAEEEVVAEELEPEDEEYEFEEVELDEIDEELIDAEFFDEPLQVEREPLRQEYVFEEQQVEDRRFYVDPVTANRPHQPPAPRGARGWEVEFESEFED